MHRTSRISTLTTLLFAAGVAVFFIKAAALPYKVAWPVLLLALSVFRIRQRQLIPIGAALLLSAAGDVVGAKGLFIPQMLFFALAHGAYMRYFLPRAKDYMPRAFSVALIGVLLVFLFGVIVPRAADPVERFGVGIYGLVIAGMLYSVLQYRGPHAAWFRCAALLFVFSDSVIAWGRFVAPVPGRTYVVMITYYLAQYLFYRFAVEAAVARTPGCGKSVTPDASPGRGA